MSKPELEVLDGLFSIHRLPPGAAVPEAVEHCTFHWGARTDEELSIVCPAPVPVPGARSASDWACIRVIGPIDFAVTGLLADLAATLANAGIAFFALSTFDTDYLLVPADRVDEAVAMLARAAYGIRQSG